MSPSTSQSALRSFLYGGAAMLLAFDIFFLIKALFTSNFVPLVPILAGIFTAAGLLFIVYAEHQAREEDKRDHRRISRVAHQLESPLRSLQDDLGQLMSNADQLPAEARLKLKHMETRTILLIENIRDVFLTLQAQEQGVAREVRSYNMCALVSDVIDEQSVLAKAHNVELLSKLHCEQAPVKVDRQLMQIVLAHVIENAILYSMTPGLVNVAVMKGKNQVRVVVQDRGVGIQAEDEQVVWRPFARGEKAEQYDPDGIGVGLTLSRLLLREFGGTISWRDREKTMGSQFEISLPLARRGN